MSSEMFPFAAHPEYQYSLEYAEKELKEAGETARRLGVRLTTHPGQVSLVYFLFSSGGEGGEGERRRRREEEERGGEGKRSGRWGEKQPLTTSADLQFTQLGSPKPKVVENAVRDLEYHNEMMDRMGLDKDSVMIIHVSSRRRLVRWVETASQEPCSCATRLRLTAPCPATELG